VNAPPPWEPLISAERVTALHIEGMKRYSPGLGGPAREGCVEGSLGAAWSAEQYQEQRRGTVEGLAFAGFLLYYLAKNHCFPDGNKRVAWLAGLRVLSALGVTVNATADEAERMILAVLSGEIRSGAEVVVWIADRLIGDPSFPA
jgi:death-on-curing protein